ncbi:MAG TPA: hypothetical protein DEG44_00820 [Candidatus Kerfeldbacteria bacterium]|nr:hypothetical protein [Candidatus Kerfeldbacteria bacterium]
MIWLALVSASLAYGATWVVRRAAQHWQVFDRKTAPRRTPLLGGVAIYLTTLALVSFMLPVLVQGYLLPKHIFGLFIAGGVLMIGGLIDDLKNLSPKRQLIFPVLACLIIVASGIGIEYISNPFGGVWSLDQYQWTIWQKQGVPYQLTLWADLFTVGWLMVSMYTTKLLDGLDGLVAGIGTIGATIIGLLSLTAVVMQPETAVVAFIFAGACFGFLLWNFSPAKIYLGEGGALLVGFMLGILAIMSGSKIATALLILGLPMLDLLAVVLRRVFIEHKSPFTGDLFHLHYQLRDKGWNDRQIVLAYYAITAGFGISTLILTGTAKVIALAILFIIGLYLVIYASHQRRR